MYNGIFTLLLGLLLISCQSKPAPLAPPPTGLAASKDSLHQALTDLHANGQINGFSVAIVNEDQILYEEGFGFADISTQSPYTARTVQNIASISKTLIGIALLKAQEMGKLDLDDPISDYLDFTVINPYFPETPITIRQLATHTSSITDGDTYDNKAYILRTAKDSLPTDAMTIPDYFNPPTDHTPMEVLLRSLLDEDAQWYSSAQYLNQAPGKRFEYTNIGATLAAYILEVATGEKYRVFTTRHILKPLGMTASGWSFEEIDLASHSKLYASKTSPLPFYSLITYPDGGLITSAHDLGMYLRELIRGYTGKGTLLTPASYEAFFTLQLEADNFTERNPDNPYNDEYNLGVFIGFSAQDYIGHTGGDPGVSSFMFFHAKDKIGRLLLINTDLTNQEGVDQFFSIWNTLEAYQDQLSEASE